MKYLTYDCGTSSYNDPTDLTYALENNQVTASDSVVRKVLGFIEGERDEADWHWLVELGNGKIAYLRGGCDYTGWDCRSSVELINEYDSLDVALSTLGLPTDCVNYGIQIREEFRKIVEEK